MRAILGGAILLVAACGGAPRPAADSTTVGIRSRTLADEPSSVIDSTRGRILGIALGMPPESVTKILGAPVRTGTDSVDSAVVTTLEYPVGTIRILPGRGVVDFLCGADGCLTADSVGVGDSSSLIVTSYGPTPPRGLPDDPEALDYRLGASTCNLTFALLGGRITSLELGCLVR